MDSNPAGAPQPPSGSTEAPVVEKFAPTSGRATGIAALVAAVAVVVAAVVDHRVPAAMVAGAAFLAVLSWAALLRPRVWATTEALVLRNMVDTVTIPLASVHTVVVRQVMAVGVGETRYVSAAIGRSRREAIKTARAKRDRPTESYTVFVEDRILQLAEEAQQRHGIARRSDEQVALAAAVHRAWAWPEIGGLVVTGATFAALLVS
ncbi:MAG: hypothetical protein ACXVD1_14305 [Nocardioides sp.]